MEWRIVSTHPAYEVSDCGLVRSIDRVIMRRCRWGQMVQVPLRGKLVKGSSASCGYWQVSLGAGNLNKRYVHRLVADAFLAPDSSRLEINHRNGDKRDNRVENLERCTRKENAVHLSRVLGKKAGQFGRGRARCLQ